MISYQDDNYIKYHNKYMKPDIIDEIDIPYEAHIIIDIKDIIKEVEVGLKELEITDSEDIQTELDNNTAYYIDRYLEKHYPNINADSTNISDYQYNNIVATLCKHFGCA